MARKLKEANDAAESARLEAGHTFDEADKQLSASPLEKGPKKAPKAYDLREKAIRISEAAALNGRGVRVKMQVRALSSKAKTR